MFDGILLSVQKPDILMASGWYRNKSNCVRCSAGESAGVAALG